MDSSPKAAGAPVNRAMYALAVLPALPVVVLIWRFALDVPVADSWDLAHWLRKYQEGTLEFADIWQLHNEHRLLFPKLILLGLALASGWNLYWELAANVILATIVGLLFAALLRREAAPGGRAAGPMPALLAALLVFSCAQYENWLIGWQLQIFLNLAAVMATILLLSREAGWGGFVAAVCLAVIASYSFANGVLVWFCAAPLLIWPVSIPKTARTQRVFVWALSAIATIGLYVYGYQGPPRETHPIENLLDPAAFWPYVFAYLGAPIIRQNGIWAVTAGLAGAILLTIPAVRAWRRSRDDFAPMRPFLCVALYAVFSALLTASARAGFGLDQALASRYVTIANLFWLAVIGVWCLGSHSRRLNWMLGLTLAILVGISSRGAFNEAANRHRAMLPARDNLIFEHGFTYLNRALYPVPEAVDERADFLREKRYGAFGKTHEYDPSHAAIHVWFGEDFLNRNMPKEAADMFRTALKMDPDNSQAHFKLAQLQAINGDFSDALEHIQQALALRPAWPEAEQLRRSIEDRRR